MGLDISPTCLLGFGVVRLLGVRAMIDRNSPLRRFYNLNTEERQELRGMLNDPAIMQQKLYATREEFLKHFVEPEHMFRSLTTIWTKTCEGLRLYDEHQKIGHMYITLMCMGYAYTKAKNDYF